MTSCRDDLEHGTTSAYVHGCVCSECRELDTLFVVCSAGMRRARETGLPTLGVLVTYPINFGLISADSQEC
jgi:hypothetical protein